MESVSLKLEPKFLKNVERAMQKNGFSTKTEFIRAAIRDKIKELEKEEILMRVVKLKGVSGHKNTDKDLHKAREKLIEVYEKNKNI